jgi:general secretion pathway protein H
MSATGRSLSEAGFTLLEMLVTLAIAGLIAGIGYPAVARGIERQEFARALADTKLALREARAQAIRRDVPTSLGLNSQGRLTAGGIIVAPQLPATITLNLPQPAPVFYGDGTTRAGGIRLRSKRYDVTLTLDRQSGLIETDS